MGHWSIYVVCKLQVKVECKNSPWFKTILFFCCFSFFLSVGKLKCSFFVVKSAGKQCQCTAISSLCLRHINEPSLHVHHLLPSCQWYKKKSTCEVINRVLLKGPQFIKFWKTKKASLIRDVQRSIFLFSSCTIPTIKIYIVVLESCTEFIRFYFG